MADKGEIAEGKRAVDGVDGDRIRRLMWRWLWATCGLTVAAEFFVSREGHFGVDGFFGFYAAIGFVACALMILGSRWLGVYLKRDEDYYVDGSEESAAAGTEGSDHVE